VHYRGTSPSRIGAWGPYLRLTSLHCEIVRVQLQPVNGQLRLLDRSEAVADMLVRNGMKPPRTGLLTAVASVRHAPNALIINEDHL
jgi:hypothetical protein